MFISIQRNKASNVGFMVELSITSTVTDINTSVIIVCHQRQLLLQSVKHRYLYKNVRLQKMPSLFSVLLLIQIFVH